MREILTGLQSLSRCVDAESYFWSLVDKHSNKFWIFPRLEKRRKIPTASRLDLTTGKHVKRNVIIIFFPHSLFEEQEQESVNWNETQLRFIIMMSQGVSRLIQRKLFWRKIEWVIFSSWKFRIPHPLLLMP